MAATSAAIGVTNAAKRVSWGAIFAGTVVAVAVHVLLSILGIAIGASVIDPAYESDPLDGIAIGTGIYLVISSILSLFVGGYVAGALAIIQERLDRTLHGIATWAVATLLMLFLVITGLSNIVSGTLGLLGKGASLAGQAASAVAQPASDAVRGSDAQPDVDMDAIRSDVRNVLRQTGDPALSPGNVEQTAEEIGQTAQNTAGRILRNPQAADEEIQRMLDRIQATAKPVISAADRDAMVNVLVDRTGMSRPEAERAVARWEKTYAEAYNGAQAQWQQLKAQAQQAAQTASDVTAQAAWWTFFLLLAGAVAAALGANVGADRLAVRETALR